MEFIFFIAVLLFSVILHEISHGFVAYGLGDPTAKNSGRLTLNPIPHIDPFGSIILPLFMYAASAAFGGGVIFGWAKPVPVNAAYLRDKKYGMLKVALAGPLSNLALAVLFGLLSRLTVFYAPLLPMREIFDRVVVLNLGLAVFNLIPIPPLDGSHILFPFLPAAADSLKRFLERYGMVILLVVIFFFFSLLVPPIRLLFSLFTGHPLY